MNDGSDIMTAPAQTASQPGPFLKTRWLCLAASLIICVCAGFGYAYSVLQGPIVSLYS